MKWTYHITNDENSLDELGENGWELVTVVPKNHELKYYLKKRKESLKERITEEQRRKVYEEKSHLGNAR